MTESTVSQEYRHEHIRATIDDLFVEAVIISSDIKQHISNKSKGTIEKFVRFFPCFNALFLMTRYDKKMKEKKCRGSDEFLVDIIDEWITVVVDEKRDMETCKRGIILFEEYTGALSDTGIITR